MNDLTILQQFTADLHRAASVADAVARVLAVLVEQLGYEAALVGLVDEDEGVLTNWQLLRQDNVSAEAKKLPHPYRLLLDEDGGRVQTAVSTNTPHPPSNAPLTNDPAFNQQFPFTQTAIFPMVWGIQPLGVLIVEADEMAETRFSTIAAIVGQTAVSIGMMRTRLRRARELALQEERGRIALDIHDAVSQTLFGLQLTLEGSLKLLDSDPDAVRGELEWALAATNQVRDQIQQTIHDNWTDEFSSQLFEADLQKYVVDVLQAHNLAVAFDIRGEFETLSAQAQRNLYRISQECLTNIVHHAAAHNARVCVDIFDQAARLVVRDDGCGFEPSAALVQEQEREHFGLRGMQDRARRLGGTCDIFSQPDAGTSIVVAFPI